MGTVTPLDVRSRAVDPPTGVLHDVRGSLNVIRGQCHAIVRTGRVGDGTIERLRLVDSEVDRIVRALDQVRSALEGRRCDATVDHVDITRLVGEAVRRHEGLAGERGVVVASIVGVGPRWVTGDADRLRRMVDNLLQNAIRACSHHGRVLLRVGGRGARVVIRIVDDGGGRGPGTPSGAGFSGAGWGMGVAIARSIAEGHGGSVTHAARDDGTSVTVVLPAATPPPAGA